MACIEKKNGGGDALGKLPNKTETPIIVAIGVARILQQVGRIERSITRRLAPNRDMGPAISLVKQGPMTVDMHPEFRDIDGLVAMGGLQLSPHHQAKTRSIAER